MGNRGQFLLTFVRQDDGSSRSKKTSRMTEEWLWRKRQEMMPTQTNSSTSTSRVHQCNNKSPRSALNAIDERCVESTLQHMYPCDLGASSVLLETPLTKLMTERMGFQRSSSTTQRQLGRHQIPCTLKTHSPANDRIHHATI